ncbi:TetR/AcrR family transcriptional regulator [Paractinoplanes toevensis]|uniref:TetR family transcriptional regulator n=1 Tax=Paractinoplanes toevensis TaxID=571911 RepID=A0A919W173_9ACTN|nr:TetR/AcrR family transcriptional regulator [Actinoplanes toevensis]GIM90079.1 TetR family transcriptional regulator [Actinoplanes toevensis]
MAFVRRPRGEYAKTADRRAEILESAIKVFSEAGFHGGSLREIAERVGLSQPGLLHHFASKEQLLEAVLTYRDDLARESMGAELPTGVALIEALIDLTAYNATTPGLVALFSVLSGEATSADHPGHQYFRRRYTWVRELTEEAVAEGQARGDLHPELDPAEVSRTLIALLDGLQIQWLYEDGGFDMTIPLRAYVRGLRTPRPTSQ